MLKTLKNVDQVLLLLVLLLLFLILALVFIWGLLFGGK